MLLVWKKIDVDLWLHQGADTRLGVETRQNLGTLLSHWHFCPHIEFTIHWALLLLLLLAELSWVHGRMRPRHVIKFAKFDVNLGFELLWLQLIRVVFSDAFMGVSDGLWLCVGHLA